MTLDGLHGSFPTPAESGAECTVAGPAQQAAEVEW